MSTFLYSATVFIAGRLFCTRADRPIAWYLLLLSAFIQSALVWLVVDASACWYLETGAVLSALTVVPLAEKALRSHESLRLVSRLLTFWAGMIALGYLGAHQGPTIRPAVRDLFSLIESELAFGTALTQAGARATLAGFLGLLLCIHEAGLVVRLTLRLLQVFPPSPPSARKNSFQHSALIGSIERLLIVVFVYELAFPAVAFILTAKSVARYHEMVDKEAAEYILIGTLVSTLAAIAIGLLVPLLA